MRKTTWVEEGVDPPSTRRKEKAKIDIGMDYVFFRVAASECCWESIILISITIIDLADLKGEPAERMRKTTWVEGGLDPSTRRKEKAKTNIGMDYVFFRVAASECCWESIILISITIIDLADLKGEPAERKRFYMNKTIAKKEMKGTSN